MPSFTPKALREHHRCTFYSAFSQDKILGNHALAREGACAAFVIKWIKDDYHGLDFSGSFVGKIDGLDEVMELYLGQKNVGGMQWRDFLEFYGLQCKSDEFYYSGGSKISVNLARCDLSDPGYYLIGISDCIMNNDRIGSGHALGFCSKGGLFKFFDPNWGRAEFASYDRAKLFLKSFAEKFYDDLKGHFFVMKYGP